MCVYGVQSPSRMLADAHVSSLHTLCWHNKFEFHLFKTNVCSNNTCKAFHIEYKFQHAHIKCQIEFCFNVRARILQPCPRIQVFNTSLRTPNKNTQPMYELAARIHVHEYTHIYRSKQCWVLFLGESRHVEYIAFLPIYCFPREFETHVQVGILGRYLDLGSRCKR